jgi:hypothetical protein
MRYSRRRAWPANFRAILSSDVTLKLPFGFIDQLSGVLIFLQILITRGKCLVYTAIHVLLFDTFLNMLIAASATDGVRLATNLGRINCVLS